MPILDPDDPSVPDPFEQLRGDKSFARAVKQLDRAKPPKPAKPAKAKPRRGSERYPAPAGQASTPQSTRNRRVMQGVGLLALATSALFAYQVVTGDSSGGGGSNILSAYPRPTSAVQGLNQQVDFGTCFDVSKISSGQKFSEESCSSPHVYELVEVTDAVTSQSDYPSDSQWDVIGTQTCLGAVKQYTGYVSTDFPSYVRSYDFIPFAQDWEDGDRKVYCAVEYTSAHTGTAQNMVKRVPGVKPSAAAA